MQQAWQILRKDGFYLRREIALYFGTLVAAWYLGPFHAWWLGPYEPGITEMLVMIAGAFLISRLIHADALAGDRQFWITRPYRWTSLLAAKLLFIVALIDLPVLFFQWFMLSREAFSFSSIWRGLLWEQFLIFGMSLLVAAFAAMTAGLVSFAAIVIVAEVVLAGISRAVKLPEHSLHSSEWLRGALGFTVVLVMSVVVLFLQYRGRHTGASRRSAFYLLAAGILGYIFVPWHAAFGIQGFFSKQPVDASSIRVSLGASNVKWALAMNRQKQVQIALPLAITGVPGLPRLETLEVLLRSANGREARLKLNRFFGPSPRASGSGNLVVSVDSELDRDFFDAERASAVALRGTLFLTIFGNAQNHTILVTQSTMTVNLTDRLRCDVFHYSNLYCDSAFRWPNQSIDMGLVAWPGYSPAMSYSPFPASLRLFPFERGWVMPLVKGPNDIPSPDPNRYIEVRVTEPVAYIRRDFEIPDVHLTDIAIPWRSQSVTRGGKSVLEIEY